MSEDADERRALEAERAAVARQMMQIQEEARRHGAVDALRAMAQLSDVAGVAAGQAPYRALLDGIAQAARHTFKAAGSSIVVLDRAADELVFEAAAGGGEVLNRRFPAHQGIAGWVVMTGEPLAVADVARDPRFAKDFAQSTGYLPRSIMAVPLLLGEEVEGVLEVLDKGDAASFGLDDLEMLAHFARPAAIAVAQSRLVAGSGVLLLQEIGRLAHERGAEELARATQEVLSAGVTPPDDTLELARLVHSLSQRGERASRLAIDVLSAIARHTG